MLNRTESEKREYDILAPGAAKAAESKGRKTEEKKCDIRTDYQRDRDRIIHSKSLRRLMHKTQVFLAPEGDHYRTRLTHTLEVSQIAKTIARALRLNEDLTEAIAMGHDLGHTPFGHNGEEFLNDKYHDETKREFKHNVQSLRVVDVLENSGIGMNLTEEVRDGILNHTGPKTPITLEGQTVKISDRIAYINHDIDDAVRSEVINKDDIPGSATKKLGNTTKERINTLVNDLIKNSDGKNEIRQSEECENVMNELRDYMFDHVYYSPEVKKDEELDKVKYLIFELYDHYSEYPDLLPDEYRGMIHIYDIDEVVKDHIAGMTDRYAINKYTEFFVPIGWKK